MSDNPRLPKASDFPPETTFVIKEFDVPLVSFPDMAKNTVSWFNWYGGEPRGYDLSFLKQGNNWEADSFEAWVGIVDESIMMKHRHNLQRAIEIAVHSHAGQVDKAGQPYILHPLRVMFAVTSWYERIPAVLHDVVEDTPVTLDDLGSERFPMEVLDAIRALTKTEGESRIAAAKRAAENSIARVVKLADVADNIDLSLISQPNEEDYARLMVYEQVRALLLSHGAP